MFVKGNGSERAGVAAGTETETTPSASFTAAGDECGGAAGAEAFVLGSEPCDMGAASACQTSDSFFT